MQHRRGWKICAVLLGLMLPSMARAADGWEPDFSNVIQAPELAAPGRGSVAGSLANLALGPAELARGGMSLPLPIVLAQERGKPLVEVIPRYTIDGGLGPWGMGWQSNLTITRFRHQGDLNYRDDIFASPWGELALGDDGHWYPASLQRFARLTLANGVWTAQLADGTVWTFAERVDGEAGGYAWFVTEAKNLVGETTRLTYTSNASGWPYLAAITYGGRGGQAQYEAAFTYAAAPALANHRAGHAISHDQRIESVEARVWQPQAKAYKTRWKYALTYTQDSRGIAYYLASVQRTFADGTPDTPVTYEYAMAMPHIAQAQLHALPELRKYMTTMDPNLRLMTPDGLSFIDIDQDGRMDFATPKRGWLMHHTDQGWQIEKLVPATTGIDESCLPYPYPPLAYPRRLLWMHPDDPVPSVLKVRTFGLLHEVTICDYDGTLRYKHRFDGMLQNLVPGETAKVVDLNRDHKPDFIDWNLGGYRVLENVSENGTYDFVEHAARVPLEPKIPLLAIWAQDINGDGLVDLVGKDNSGLFVWWGIGNFRFLNPAQKFPVYTLMGDTWPAVDLGDYDVSFVDANNDGLTDVLLTKMTSAWLHINNGKAFYHTPMDATQSRYHRTILGPPVVQNLSGRGNAEVIFASIDSEALAIELNTPATGLMTAVDDGKGTRVEFTYGRAAPKPRVPARPPVLTGISIKHGGVPAAASAFAYLDPKLHPEGRFVLGYSAVEAQRPDLAERVEFIQDPIFRGAISKTSRQNLQAPILLRETAHNYTQQLFHGLPFARLSESRDVWRDPVSQTGFSRTTQHTRYEQDFCPVETRITTGAGTLMSSKVLAAVAALAGLPHCLTGEETVTGAHPDRALDFAYKALFQRNEAGQVTQIAHVGGADIIAQEVQYDAQHRPVLLEKPGQGAQLVAYDADTGLVASVTAPDGVVRRAAARDPVTDAVLTLAMDRGGVKPYQEYFRHDSQERLCKRWDDRVGYSETTPLEVLAYRDTTHNKPGLIDSHLLVDPAHHITQHSAALFRGDGKPLGAAKAVPEGWLLTALETTDPEKLISQKVFKGVVGAAELEPATFADLYAGTTALDVSQVSGLGQSLLHDHLVQENVHQTVQTSYAIDATGLRVESIRNQSRHTMALLDMGGRAISSTDAAGNTTTNTYDAMGRLRRVTLPDGSRQTVELDVLGRPSFVSRDGIAQIAYKYASGTGLLEEVTYADMAGQAERMVRFTYDSAGRKNSETFEATRNAAKVHLTYLYDGAQPRNRAAQAGQRGLLTAVVGDDFSKAFTYGPDGALQRREESVGGWRALTETLAYYGDGSIKSTTTTITSASGQTLSKAAVESRLDAHGRVASTTLNGQPLCDLAYDSRGELAQIQCPKDTTFSFSRDAATHRLNGIYAESAAWPGPASLAWELGVTGAPVSERLDVGAQSRDRRYDYDHRDFLTAWAENGAPQDRYAYGTSGLRTLPTSAAPSRDSSGRATHLGHHTLTYGPDGHLAAATDASGVTTTYAYDETGRRILQKTNGQPVLAYLGHDILESGRIMRPLDVGGHVVGVLVDGSFHPILTDSRGTVVVADAGIATWASPFGKRASPPPLCTAVDFAGGGRDPVLGTIRLGVRDYDPTTGQFLTPDPAVLANPGLCLDDPSQCNLYSYARNNPLAFADNDGQFAHIVVGAGLGGLAGAAWEGWTQYQQGTFNARRLAIATVGGAATWGAVAAVPTAGVGMLARSAATGLLIAEGNRTTRSYLGQGTSVAQYLGEAAFGGLLGALPGAPAKTLSGLENQMSRSVRFGPMNPGPLPDTVAQNFRSLSYSEVVSNQPTVLYRAYGGTAREISSWWTRTPPAGGLQAQLDSALLPQWGNTAQKVSAIRVPPGTAFYEGAAAPQAIMDTQQNVIGEIMGGGSQVFIPRVDESWLLTP